MDDLGYRKEPHYVIGYMCESIRYALAQIDTHPENAKASLNSAMAVYENAFPRAEAATA